MEFYLKKPGLPGWLQRCPLEFFLSPKVQLAKYHYFRCKSMKIWIASVIGGFGFCQGHRLARVLREDLLGTRLSGLNRADKRIPIRCRCHPPPSTTKLLRASEYCNVLRSVWGGWGAFADGDGDGRWGESGTLRAPRQSMNKTKKKKKKKAPRQKQKKPEN